ncbi:PMS1 protein homolog 1 [Rhizophagus clarus]|uniref:PMS1 protein homolog 1 n=1 Tax=Rhizophagus clarus TaxID=94130 RepID=A0A8H3M5D3_9GLOM|nr:PMS1 protein homolog 1 [Rhizophagus clarus]
MIRPLDNSTVRRISSGQVITKVEDVVKELVENSIDAESTSIEVKLVGDGLTSITVKDNGVGIQECDRPAMAMRYHTSKLYKFEDLNNVDTYGFRGEALNSICAVTESTQIITKTENDPVATLYTLDRSGRILDEKSFGSSPGTTVTAVRLFSNIPVRRQVAQKNTSIGKNIQNLLITYALAHPHIRFSLKQENNSKIKFKEGDWVQPAMKNTMDAIIKLFGSELANEVQIGVWSSDAESIEISENVNVDENDCNNVNTQQFVITLEAVLPKPDADPCVIFKNGKTFIYVNNRPVTTNRGEIRSLVSMVKTIYNEIACRNGWKGNPKTPFVLINIKLPTWAYDINVEPSKNVALFHYGERLMETVSNLLEMIYDLNSQPKEQNTTSIAEGMDQPVESIIDDDNMNDRNVHVEEITVDQLERALTKTFDSSIKKKNIIPSELYAQPDNLSERDVQSYSRPEACQRASGTTTPIHEQEAAEALIMISGVSNTEEPTSKDTRQYVRQEIHPVQADKVKQKMYDYESRKRNNVTKKNDWVQCKNSNPKDGTIDNWLKNCQTQDVDTSYTPPYDEPQTTGLVSDDEQGSNFTCSPTRKPHSYTELSSYNNLNSSNLRDSSHSGRRDTYNNLLPQNNRESGDLLLTPPNSKSVARDTELQLASPINNLCERPHGDVANPRNDQGTQLDCYAMDSDDPFADDATAKRDSNDTVNDNTAEPMHKRPRIDNMNDNIVDTFAPETSGNDLNESRNHESTLHNGQSQNKEMGMRTIAIGQPTIDDLLKSGAINLPSGTNNKNVATNVNAQLQQLKKKSASDNRLASSLTDVLNQELKLKFNKLRIMRRNKSTFYNQIGCTLSCFNKLDYGMWTVTRKFNEKFMDILMVHGERIRELVTLETLVTSTELNPTRKLLNPIDVTVEQLGSVRMIECLKRFTFDQIPDESGAGIWWNMVTQKCLTANGIKVRWREDNNDKIYIQLTHISPLVQFATAVEYFVHLMKHLCCLNADNDRDIPFVNTRARLTMQILAREARQMVKHEDWTINKRDDEMKQRVKDATTHLMHRIKDFGRSSPGREDDEIDELTPFTMFKKKNDEEIWYNGEIVVKVLWKNIEEVNLQ